MINDADFAGGAIRDNVIWKGFPVDKIIPGLAISQGDYHGYNSLKTIYEALETQAFFYREGIAGLFGFEKF